MTLEDAIINFSKNYINERNDWYCWRRINEKKIPLGITLPQGNQYIKNIALKKELNKKWITTKSSKEKKLITSYYISTWGGIHGNSDKNIDLYSLSSADDLITRGSKGIASWSKAICLHNPYKYAIYDARVSASLNSLQIINNVENKLFFPILSSRNNIIGTGANYIKKEATNTKWKSAEEIDFYMKYLKYLENSVSVFDKKLNVELFTIEMLLFAKSEELVCLAFPNKKF